MFNYSFSELELCKKITELKNQAGSHSPSIFTYKQKLPEIDIKVDACFLSNPYATDLFVEYFNEEVVRTDKIRDILEFYPSQNGVIAELLARFLNVNPSNVFIGNGAIEIIQAVIHNFTVEKILINIPTFSSYYEYVRRDVKVVFNTLKKENQYSLDIEEYIELVKSERPDTIVLINPNNPNGAFINSVSIEKMLSELDIVNTIILDESFIHFAYEDSKLEMVSMAKLIEKFPNLIVIKSMSKDFGVAGIRAGYGVMAKERVSSLLKYGYLWNSNGFAEYFFRLYTRTDFAYNYNQVRVKYILETLDFITKLESIPYIKVYPSKANFVLLELLNGMNSNDFVALMLIKFGIYVRTCEDKIGLTGQFVRLASRSKTENEYIINSFREVFV